MHPKTVFWSSLALHIAAQSLVMSTYISKALVSTKATYHIKLSCMPKWLV